MSMRFAVPASLLLLCFAADDVSLYQTTPSLPMTLAHSRHMGTVDVAPIPDDGSAYVQDSESKVDSVHMARQTDEVDPGSQLEEKCSPLKNAGPYSLIDVEVGTPPQEFSLVADTGSDLVIIQDCSCSEKGLGCSTSDRCFQESSSTFIQDGITDYKITFGSGDVIADTATDVVQMNGVKAKMKKGVVLMRDRSTLTVSEHFEGIIGLGPPVPKTDEYAEPLFLEEAKEPSFTMCFNDFDTTGALRINDGEVSNMMTTVGTRHWSLSFEGLAVGEGDDAASIGICEKTPSSQTYPCGVVFDSGTTYILGPQSQINDLYGSICDAWPRCKEAQDKDTAKNIVFTDLVRSCGEWLDGEDGLNELPTLTFKVAGANGVKQSLELSGWAYIFEEEAQKKKKSSGTPNCVAAFGDNDGYATLEHGDVWIFGTPVYFDYVVAHDMNGPGLGFDKTSCNSCGGATSHLLHRTARKRRTGVAAQPRPQVGAARRGIVTGSPL